MPFRVALNRTQKENTALSEQVKVLERALQFYGNPEYYGDRGEYWAIVIDEGRTARKALKEAAGYGQEKEA